MSDWSYITGVIKVRSNTLSDEMTECMLKTCLRHMPQIWGSEGGVEFYVNKFSNSSTSTITDELDNRLTGMYYYTTHNCWLITLCGYLRDTDYTTAINQVNSFGEEFCKYYEIEHSSIIVSSSRDTNPGAHKTVIDLSKYNLTQEKRQDYFQQYLHKVKYFEL